MNKINPQAIKIDPRLLRGVTNPGKNQEIVKAIIALGKQLEIKTVATGVENEATYAALKSWGCDYIQGFYTGKPAPGQFISEMLAQGVSRSGD